MGGLITIELATRHPDLVAAAILNDIGPLISQAGLARISGYVGAVRKLADWQGAADVCAALNHDVFPDFGAADWLAMARRLFREADGGVIPDYDPAIAGALGRIVAEPDPWAKWHSFADQRPVLVLRGTLTDLLDGDVAEAMVSGKAQARLVPVANVGHAPMLDEPDAWAAIAGFLASSE